MLRITNASVWFQRRAGPFELLSASLCAAEEGEGEENDFIRYTLCALRRWSLCKPWLAARTYTLPDTAIYCQSSDKPAAEAEPNTAHVHALHT
eukprot:6176327-Pleurochrysis_carterae.AAC.1